MIQIQRKGLYVLIVCAVFQFQTVCGQRAIFSLGKRLQQRFSGNPPSHVSDVPSGENDTMTKWHLAAAATTLLLVVLGYSSQKRVAAGGEFAFVLSLSSWVTATVLTFGMLFHLSKSTSLHATMY